MLCVGDPVEALQVCDHMLCNREGGTGDLSTSLLRLQRDSDPDQVDDALASTLCSVGALLIFSTCNTLPYFGRLNNDCHGKQRLSGIATRTNIAGWPLCMGQNSRPSCVDPRAWCYLINGPIKVRILCAMINFACIPYVCTYCALCM